MTGLDASTSTGGVPVPDVGAGDRSSERTSRPNATFSPIEHPGGPLMREALSRVPDRTEAIPGLANPNERMEKGLAKTLAYRILASDSLISRNVANAGRTSGEMTPAAFLSKNGTRNSRRRYRLGVSRNSRVEHHESHAANAYYAPRLRRGAHRHARRLRQLAWRARSASVGRTYERLHGVEYRIRWDVLRGGDVGSRFQAEPARGEDRRSRRVWRSRVLRDVLLARFDQQPGSSASSRATTSTSRDCWSSQFPKIDVAAAYQHVLEQVAHSTSGTTFRQTGIRNLVLSAAWLPTSNSTSGYESSPWRRHESSFIRTWVTVDAAPARRCSHSRAPRPSCASRCRTSIWARYADDAHRRGLESRPQLPFDALRVHRAEDRRS